MRQVDAKFFKNTESFARGLFVFLRLQLKTHKLDPRNILKYIELNVKTCYQLQLK